MSDTPADVVYRTVQKEPTLTGRYVGPLFGSQDEAKRAVEHFVETEHNAVPTEWHDEGDRLRMTPSATRSEFFIEAVPVRGSLDELLADPEADDGQEVTAFAD